MTVRTCQAVDLKQYQDRPFWDSSVLGLWDSLARGTLVDHRMRLDFDWLATQGKRMKLAPGGDPPPWDLSHLLRKP